MDSLTVGFELQRVAGRWPAMASSSEMAARRILAEGTLSGVRGAATLFARAERDLRVAADYCRIAGSPRALAFVRARRRLYRAERRAIERACGERRRAYGAI